MSTRIVLACSSDAGYAPHAAVMLYSALERTPEAQFVIHYLQDPGFPEAERERIRQSLARFGTRAELHFRQVSDDLVAGLPLFSFMKPGAIAPVMWYRVLLPQLLPDEPKVLYLDCDTLALDSLVPLWNTALDEQAVAAVSNPFWEGYNGDQPWPSVCGLSNAEDYFNSGVMLINLDYFRQHDVTARVIAHGQANASWVRFGDQDSLVSVLHGACTPAPALQPHAHPGDDARRKADVRRGHHQRGDREAGDPALRGHHQALGRSDAASLRPPLHAHRPATALAGA